MEIHDVEFGKTYCLSFTSHKQKVTQQYRMKENLMRPLKICFVNILTYLTLV